MKSNKAHIQINVPKALPEPSCVLRVGPGRGFVVEYPILAPPKFRQLTKMGNRKFLSRRVVLTAAHCLKALPPAHGMAHYWERTYKGLLGTIGTKRAISAECLFVDPVADIAVLGSPDSQEMYKEAEAYEKFISELFPIRMGKPKTGRGWLLSLDGRWISTSLKVASNLSGPSLIIGPTKSGMSGSPILNNAGRAVGMVTLSSAAQPILVRDLPARFIT